MQCVAPPADSCEEVALCESCEVAGANIDDASLVNLSSRNESALDKLPKPSCCVFVVFIVIVHRAVIISVLLFKADRLTHQRQRNVHIARSIALLQNVQVNVAIVSILLKVLPLVQHHNDIRVLLD